MASACTESISSMDAISQSWLSRRKPRFTSDNVPLLLSTSQSLQRVGGDRDEFYSDEDEWNNVSAAELRAHGKASVAPQPNIVFKDIPIRVEDTLINLALRYNCSMSDLKRYNKLANNNDLYALNVLRVPVLRHGIVGQVIEEENIEKMSLSSNHETTVAVQNCNSWKCPECSSTCDSNLNIDDENNCESHCLIHTTDDYTPSRLKYDRQSRGHEQVAKMFREVDINVQNIASTLPGTFAADDESKVSNMVDKAEEMDRHYSRLKWCNGKTSWKLIVFVCVALLLALGLLIRHFLT